MLKHVPDMLKHVSDMLRGKNYMLKHVVDLLDCPQTETKQVSDMLSGKAYLVNHLRERVVPRHSASRFGAPIPQGSVPQGSGLRAVSSARRAAPDNARNEGLTPRPYRLAASPRVRTGVHSATAARRRPLSRRDAGAPLRGLRSRPKTIAPGWPSQERAMCELAIHSPLSPREWGEG